MSAEHTPPPANPYEAFCAYEDERHNRITFAQQTLEEATALFAEGYDAVNARLAAAGRPDLAITEPAQQMPCDSPKDVLGVTTSNFTPSFSMCTGKRETGELNFRGEPELIKITPTEADILALRDVPLTRSYDDVAAIRHSDTFTAAHFTSNHATKMFFVRGLTLFPEFFSKLVVGISSAGVHERRPFARYESELFVAYQILSKLVDAEDLYARKDDGTLDDWYLCH